MRQAQSISFSRQLRVVFMTYLTRPGLRWSLLAAAGPMCVTSLLHALGAPYRHPSVLTLLLTGLAMLMAISGWLFLIFTFFLHARQQLMGSVAQLTPHPRKPNLIAAGTFVFLLALLITLVQGYGAHAPSWLGLFAVSLAFILVIGFSTARPLCIPLFIVGGFLLFRYANLGHTMDQISTDWKLIYDEDERFHAEYVRMHPIKHTAELDERLRQAEAQHNKDYYATVVELKSAEARIAQDIQLRTQTHYEQLERQRISILLGDVLAMGILGALATPRRKSAWFGFTGVSRSREFRASFDPVAFSPVHRFRDSTLARRLHRRFAVHDWRAAVVAAGAMLGLGLWFNLEFPKDGVAALTMMLAFLPGALVAIGWRERWANFDFESLYPVTRRQFVTDMAAALLLDAAEFWLAAMLATLVACIGLRVEALRDGRFWAAILCSAMMQFFWLGAIFFIGQRRQTLTYVAGLTPFVLAMFLPLEALWRWDRPAAASGVVLITFGEMTLGIVMFASTWILAQRSPTPAPSLLP